MPIRSETFSPSKKTSIIVCRRKGLNFGDLASGASKSVIGLAIAAGAGGVSAPQAQAQTLTGAQTATISLTSNPLTVNTDPGFSVITTTNDAITLTSSGGITFEIKLVIQRRAAPATRVRL